MSNYPPDQSLEEVKAPVRQNQTSANGSEKDPSESSEQVLQKIREEFKKKEIIYKRNIQQLNSKISQANESCKEMSAELGFAQA